MRNCRQAVKYCAVIALAILLVGAALYLPVPGGKTGTGTAMRPWQHGSSAGEPGVLMVLQLPGPGAPGQQGRGAVWADLSRMGVEQGDPLDSGHILVRVPSGKLQAAQAAAGSNLAEYQPSARLSPDLAAAPAENNPDAMLSVNVTVFESGDKEAVARSVPGLGGGVLWGEVQDGRVLQIRLPRGRLEDLAQLPEVVYIEPVRTYSLLNDRARDIVGATPLEALGWLAPESSLTGSGQIVGLADSGLDRGSVDEIHPDLASPPGGVTKVVALKSLAGAATAADTNGHGTHMAATIAGTGAASGGQYQGLAPGASLYFQGLTNPEGQLEPPPDLADLFGPAYEAGVRIHVDGWGDDASGYFSSASQTDGFIRAHPDFLVIFSAGNGGPGPGTLTSEAYTKNGLVVGASQSPHPMFDSEQVDSSSPSDFSSRGPTGDGRLKPELLAPGALISAKASQVTSEFDLGNYYTYMEGTSMAAAVAGGSAALLREYFQRFEQVASPSAALLKASLINGASTPASGPTKDGFGILDLGGTILALHEKTFQYIDSSKGVANDGTSTYTFQVQGGDSPLKATLAWTDPAAAPGSAHPLVNNLDLEVRDPSGKLWLGNSFLSPGQADDVNNVEQAFIPRPVAGSYTIYVKGTSIVQNTVPGASQNSQDFALVFGQPLVRDIVVSSSGSLVLKSGRDVQLDQARVSYEQDGKTVAWPVAATAGVGAASSGTAGSVEPSVGDSLCGADIYLPPDMEANNPAYAYLAGRTWQVQGVQVVDTGSGLIYTEIDPARRTGGFSLAPGASGRFWVNGRQLQQLASMPPGVEIRASINPGTQTIWEADVDYQQVANYLGRVDQAQGELWLLGQQKPLSLTPQAELAYLDELTAIDTADLPFGASTVPAWDKLLPGLKLKLMVAPDSGEVMYVGAQRQLAVGKIAAVDPDAETVVLNSGNSSYIVGQGVTLQLDGQAAQLKDLQPGQLVMAVLVPGSRQVLSLAAYSQVLYGRVVYVSDKEQLLYLVDSMNNFHVVNLSAGTQVFRWGLPSGLNFIAPGAWVRLCLDPGTGQAQRLDVAESAADRTEIFSSYDQQQGILYTDQGSYQVAENTLVTKNGYLVTPGDLVEGEELTLSPLLDSALGKPLLAVVAAQTKPGAVIPKLEVAAPWRGGIYVSLSCFTTADRLYIYLPDGERQSVPVVKGRNFLYSFQPAALPAAAGTGQQGLVLQLVAFDNATGGVTGQTVTVPAAGIGVLGDLDGSWAAAAVKDLLAQNLITGYPDGTYRPEQPITRAEFAVLLSKAMGWSGSGSPLSVEDAQEIPAWAKPGVGYCLQHGLFQVGEDGSFHPDQPLTRAEAAVVLDKALQVFDPGVEKQAVLQPGWQDWLQIPSWAQLSAARVFTAGIMSGVTSQEFSPNALLKRGEAAVVIDHLLEELRQVH